METIKAISNVLTNAIAVGFIIIMIAGLALNTSKIKKLEDNENGK